MLHTTQRNCRCANQQLSDSQRRRIETLRSYVPPSDRSPSGLTPRQLADHVMIDLCREAARDEIGRLEHLLMYGQPATNGATAHEWKRDDRFIADRDRRDACDRRTKETTQMNGDQQPAQFHTIYLTTEDHDRLIKILVRALNREENAVADRNDREFLRSLLSSMEGV